MVMNFGVVIAVTLLFASLGLQPESAFAISKDAEKQLLDKSSFWQERGDVHRARGALEKLLAANPNHAKALAQLGMIEAHAGNRKKALEYLKRLRRVDSKHQDVKNLERVLGGEPGQDHLLKQARTTASQGQFEEAVVLYKQLFGAKKPKGDLALEYYQTAASLTRYWNFSRKGLEELVSQFPNNQNYALALAKHLTYRKATRMRGIGMLESQIKKGKETKETFSVWRKALLWLPVQAASIPAYEAYLKKAGRDKKISALIAEAKAPPKVKQADLNKAQAFYELNQGSAVKAGRLFAGFLKKHKNDADAHGGLGVALLKQRRFSKAEQHLARAMQLDRKAAARWSAALHNAQYWGLLKRAKEDLDAGKLSGAEKKLKKAVKILPQEPEGRMALARLQIRQGHETKAIKSLEALLLLAPDHYPARLELIRLRVQNNAGDATEAALNLLEAYPGQQGNSQLFMEAYSRYDTKQDAQRLSQRAQTALEQNVVANPDNIWARLDLAKMYRLSGQQGKSISLLNGLIRLHPDMAEARYLKAQMDAEAGRWDDAADAMQGISEEGMSKDMLALNRKIAVQKKLKQALALAKVGRDDEAVTILDNMDAKSMMSDHANLTLLANAWSTIGKPLRALRIGRQMIHAAPEDDYDAKLLYVTILIAAHEDAEADIWLKHLLAQRGKMNAQQQQSLHDLGRGQAIRQSDQARLDKNFVAAWDSLEPYLDNELSDVDVMLALARIYHDANRDREALSIYKDILQQEPDNKDALEAAVYSAISINDFKLAEQLVNQGIFLEPEQERFYLLQGRLERARGNDGEALKAFKKVEALQRLKQLQQRARDVKVPAVQKHQRLRNPFANAETSMIDHRKYAPPNVLQESFQPVFSGVKQQRARARSFELRFEDDFPQRRQKSWNNAQRNVDTYFASANTSTHVSGVPVRMAQADAGVNREISEVRSALSTVASAGLNVRDRQGEAGLSQLNNIESPVKVRFRPFGNTLHLKMTPVLLSAGEVDMGNTNLARRFGSNDVAAVLPQAKQISQRDLGVAFQTIYEIGGVKLDLGVSPLGFSVSNFIGGLAYHSAVDDLQFDFGISRRAVTDSFLSYAGTRDPASNLVWGGVVKNSISTGFSYTSQDRIGMYGKLGYGRLTGKNVLKNNVYDLTIGGYGTLFKEEDAALRAGINLSILGYSKNLQYYTLGHGGYFSPQQYASISVPVSFSDVDGALSYRISGHVGLQMFQEDSVAFFPNDPQLQAASGRFYTSANTSSFLLGIDAAAEYVLTRNLSVGANIGFDNAKNYNQVNLGIYMHYRFDGLTKLPGFRIDPLRAFSDQDI